MRSLYNAASKGLPEPWIKKKEVLRAEKHSAFMGSSGKICSGISSSFLVSTLEKGCWNLEMLQREATKITSVFKWIPCWECFKEVHLFGLSKERCRSYLTLSSKYLPDVNNVLLSLPKKSGSKTNAWNRTKKRKHILRVMSDYFLEEPANKNKGFSISWCLEIKKECLSIK